MSTSRRRGAILLLTLQVMGALVFFCVLFLEAVRDNQLRHATDQVVALCAAEAGIADALYELNQDHDWVGGFAAQPLSSGATYTVTFTGSPRSTNNVAGNATVSGEGGRAVPAGWIHVVSLGSYASATVRMECLAAVESDELREKLRWRH